MFEEEKKFNSRTLFFFWKIVPYWMYFGQVHYSSTQATKNSLNEGILLMAINEALLSR